MLIFGLISPHPPLIIPEIGGDDIKQVRGTTEALDKAVDELAGLKPDELIIISPHDDHGFQVPEYYLCKRLPEDLPAQEILVTESSYQYYYDYGRYLGERLRADDKHYAVVASGDLSHVLKDDGPYGFDPAGPELDQQIVEAVRARDVQALLNIDPVVLDEGAECGLRSILFLLGAFEGMDVDLKVLSYEGPFGVGYMVATIEPHHELSLTVLGRKAIGHYLETGKVMATPRGLSDDWRRRAGVFVSLRDLEGALRGCIGTIGPVKASLAAETIANAVAAATADERFEPVTAGELDELEIEVEVLGPLVPVTNTGELDPAKYGLVVSARDGRKGVLLPGVEGVDTVDEQIRICRDKAGIGAQEPVELAKFTVERYE